MPTVDTFELARSRRRVDGGIDIACLPRLMEFLTASEGSLHYAIEGLIDDRGHPAADLTLKGRLPLICQRCSAPLEFELSRTTRFRFVATEQELNALPIEDDEIDAIVGSPATNLYDWIEDEAILSLPLVPRHDDCTPVVNWASDERAAAAPNPFAVLKAAKEAANGKG